MRGLSLVAASGGHSSSRCTGLSLSRPLLLQNTGSRRAGSVIVAPGPSRSAACGILADQGSNPCPLHWQADSQPLRHRGSPCLPPLDDLCWHLHQTWTHQCLDPPHGPPQEKALLTNSAGSVRLRQGPGIMLYHTVTWHLGTRGRALPWEAL